MGVYIKGELPTEFNGMYLDKAVEIADKFLEEEPVSEHWNAIRTLRDFCECITDDAVEIPTPHGRLIDEGLYWDILENSFDTDPRFNSDTEIIRCYREAWDITPTVIEAEE